jgi:hypothetical protein
MSENEKPQAADAPAEADGKREPPPGYKRLSSILSLLLSLSVIFTVMASWEAEVDTSSSEITAIEFNYTQAQIISQAAARQNYATYGYYWVNQQMADSLAALPNQTPEIEAMQQEASLIASYTRHLFPGRYLKPDGGYDFERNAREEMAALSLNTPLNSAPIQAEIDRNRELKSYVMQVVFILGMSTAILGFEKIFYWERRWVRYMLAITGVALLLLGLAGYLWLGPNPLAQFRLG